MSTTTNPEDIAQIFSGDSADIVTALRDKMQRAILDVETEMLADIIQQYVSTTVTLAAQAVHEAFGSCKASSEPPDASDFAAIHEWLAEQVLNLSLIANGK
jgi:hypothetical protein